MSSAHSDKCLSAQSELIQGRIDPPGQTQAQWCKMFIIEVFVNLWFSTSGAFGFAISFVLGEFILEVRGTMPLLCHSFLLALLS